MGKKMGVFIFKAIRHFKVFSNNQERKYFVAIKVFFKDHRTFLFFSPFIQALSFSTTHPIPLILAASGIGCPLAKNKAGYTAGQSRMVGQGR